MILSLRHEHAGELNFITLPTMKNLAKALLHDPKMARIMRKLVCTVGAVSTVKVFPVAEVNIFKDQKAARIVFTFKASRLK